MSEMQQILSQQKREFHTSQTKQRQYLIQRKMKDIRRDRQQMSDGSVKHDDFFRKSNRQLDFFDPKFPLLKFPQDTVLNTYDNTKRWLKEIDIPDKKQYWQELKQHDFKHYEGDPWNYITKANRYFEGFKAYHFIEHEESGIEKNQRIKAQDQYKYMVPPTRTPSEFSRPQFDKTYIINPLNPIHEVKYIPGLIVDRSKLSSMHKTRGSMLNDLQTVKPFTAQNTRSQPFQKKYKPLNCEDHQLESTLRTDVDSDI